MIKSNAEDLFMLFYNKKQLYKQQLKFASIKMIKQDNLSLKLVDFKDY
jgi:hypothetical protein